MYALRLLAFLRPYKLRTALAFVAIVGSGGFVLVIPQLIRWAINFGLGRVEDGRFVIDGSTRTLVIASLAIVGAALMRGGFSYLQTYLGEWISQRVAYDLRNRIYDRLQRLSYAYHDHQQTGQLMSRATADVEAVRMFTNFGTLRLLQTVVQILLSCYLLISMSLQLTLIVFALLPLVAYRAISTNN